MSETEAKRPPLERQKSKDLHVKFLSPKVESDEKKKYLTAKFKPNEMDMIRKRFAVEQWMLDKLNELCQNAEEEVNLIDIDLDEILDIKNEVKRLDFIMSKLAVVNKLQKADIDQFVECLFEKLKSITNLDQ